MTESTYLAIAKEAQKVLESTSIPDITRYILRNPLKWSAEWHSVLADQWHFQKKAKQKLGPWWEKHPNLVGPPKLSWEQSSSHPTATWKAQQLSPPVTILDMTGGWGMDALFFSMAGARVIHCELQPILSDLIEENARILQTSIETYRGSSFDFLAKNTIPIDLIYLDPARRDAQQKKVVRLADLTPNLTDQWTFLLSKAPRIWVKLSPMMDLQELVSQIPGISQVRLLSVRNELKEILVEVVAKPTGKIRWEAIELPTEGDPISFVFDPSQEQPADTVYGEPKEYVYEPYVGILKLGAFHQIAAMYGLQKLHPHTHLYTSETYRGDFPGRIFRVMDAFKAKPAEAFARLGKPLPTNILVRNFGENGEALANKWQIKPIDTVQFLIFTQTIVHHKWVLYAHRLL